MNARVDENIAPVSINTLAILRKLKRYEQIKKINEQLIEIDARDKRVNWKSAISIFADAVFISIEEFAVCLFMGVMLFQAVIPRYESMEAHVSGKRDNLGGAFVVVLKVIILVGFAQLFSFLMRLNIPMFLDGLSAMNKRMRVGELPEEIRKVLSEILTSHLNHQVPIYGMEVGEAIALLKTDISTVLEDKEMLNNMRFSFLMSVNKIIGKNLPEEILYKIFYEAELILNKPMDQHEMAERRFAFLMGRVDVGSSIPANLTNEIAYKIFKEARLPTKYPHKFVSEVVIPNNNDDQIKESSSIRLSF